MGVAMSKLRVLVVHNNSVELDRISNLLEKDNHLVFPLEKMSEASEALELQLFDAVLIPNDTPQEDLAVFASNLRKSENSRHAQTRTSILSCSRNVTETEIWMDGQSGHHIDACLPVQFEPSTFTRTVEQLSCRVSSSAAAAKAEPAEQLVSFDPDGFRDLLGDNAELMEEIIGLFLEESSTQVAEMDDCVASQDFEMLSKVAHTLKGSLGTLHAPRARSHAQALESAAIEKAGAVCEHNLSLLKEDLSELIPQLIRLRSSL